MSAETYLNLLNAIQEHIVDEVGSDVYSPHWVMVAGIEAITGEESKEILRIYRSPKTAPYVLSGLLDYALQTTSPDIEIS